MFRDKITISPLLLRLLTLNILILFFIVGGLISIDRYQQTLQENEFKKLEDEGKILSQAIGRTILPIDDLRSQVIITKEAQETIGYLLSKSRVRIRLFSYQGDLLADSERSVGFQTRIKSVELPSLEKKNIFQLNSFNNEKNIPQRFGLRHRAAVGITEKTDALAIVVSEETGQISYIKNGEFVMFKDTIELSELVKKDLA